MFVCLFAVNAKTMARIDAKRSGIKKCLLWVEIARLSVFGEISYVYIIPALAQLLGAKCAIAILISNMQL